MDTGCLQRLWAELFNIFTAFFSDNFKSWIVENHVVVDVKFYTYPRHERIQPLNNSDPWPSPYHHTEAVHCGFEENEAIIQYRNEIFALILFWQSVNSIVFSSLAVWAVLDARCRSSASTHDHSDDLNLWPIYEQHVICMWVCSETHTTRLMPWRRGNINTCECWENMSEGN